MAKDQVKPQVVTRAGWGARAPAFRSTFPTAGDGVFIHYTSSSADRVDNHALCAARVKNVQAFHMGPSRGWSDIAYSFLVCQHGVIFEGRGWGVQGAHTQGYNASSHAFCFLGGDTAMRDVTDEARLAFAWLIAEAQRRYPQSDRVRGHGDVNSTSCPGAELHAWVRAKGWLELTPPGEEEEKDAPFAEWFPPWARWYLGKPPEPAGYRKYRAALKAWDGKRPKVAPRIIPPKGWEELVALAKRPAAGLKPTKRRLLGRRK
jgi:hypothetical protein